MPSRSRRFNGVVYKVSDYDILHLYLLDVQASHSECLKISVLDFMLDLRRLLWEASGLIYE